MRIEHIGIAVRNLREANELFSKLLNVKPYKSEFVETEGVTTSFFQTKDLPNSQAGVKIELLESANENSAIKKFIEKHGEGIHHIAFEVENIEDEIQRLKNLGFQIVNEKPHKGADNKLVAFIHPKSCGGVLVELCQSVK